MVKTSRRWWTKGKASMRRFWHQYASLAIVLLGLIVLVCGYQGFCIQEAAQHDEAAVSSGVDGGIESGRQSADGENRWLSRGRRVYKTVRLLILETGDDTPDNFYLFWARFGALAILLYTAFRVLRALLADSFDRFYLNWIVRRHAVVCGLGDIGTQLVQDLRRPGPQQRPVVVVDNNEENPNLHLCRDLRATVVFGDATDRETLEKLRLDRAEALFVTTGQDATNAEVTVRACEVLQGTTSSKLRCHTHISKHTLVDAFKQYEAIAKTCASQQMDLRVFNVLANSARQLAREQLPYDRPAPDEVAHYVILGFGELGQRVALELARMAHFDNRRRCRMTIFDANLKTVERRFRLRYPKFCPEQPEPQYDWARTDLDEWGDRSQRPAAKHQVDGDDAERQQAVEYVCNAEFIELRFGLDDERFGERLLRLATPRTHVSFVCAFDDDDENSGTALRLRTILDQLDGYPKLRKARIYASLRHQSGLSQMLKGRPGSVATPLVTHPKSPTYNLVPFGECRDSCNLRQVEQPSFEAIAQAFFEDYCKLIKKVPPEWEDLDEWERASNRHVADHLDIKLAMLGDYSIAERQGPLAKSRETETKLESKFELLLAGTPVTEDERQAFEQKLAQRENAELLAQIEHNRYMAERLLEGWGYGDRGKTGKSKFLRKTFCPWDKVNPDERPKDYEQVETIARILGLGDADQPDA